MKDKLTYQDGIIAGLPVCFAYLAVSFTFGLTVVGYGAPAWLATLISGTNLTSAGQFAGVNLMAVSAGFLEIIIALLVINSRYALMSLSISQQLDQSVGTVKRLIMSFFVTDEIFALATVKKDKLNFAYFMGLSTTPYFGWTLGTLFGALLGSVLPERLSASMGIALYCMFIAIVLPPCKKSKPIILCVAISVALTCLMYYVKAFSFISFGFRVVIAALIASVIVAVIFPIKDADKGNKEGKTEVAEKAESGKGGAV